MTRARCFSPQLTSVVKDQGLLRSNSFIGGSWTVGGQSAESFAVKDPASKKTIGDCTRANLSDVEAGIVSAANAAPKWAQKSGGQRAAILLKWSELILAARSDLAHITTLENGKMLREALGEVQYAASFAQFYGEETRRGLSGEAMVEKDGSAQLFTVRQPVGVVAAITPWNFPLAMITRKAAAALGAGCSVVLKPSEHTPFSALALAELGHRAGIPAGVINVVVSDNSKQIGGVLASSLAVNKLTFTGSTAVGKELFKRAAESVKRVSLELGGNAPFIVTESADVKQAVRTLIASKFRNSGQTCICPNRIFVQSQIMDEFQDLLVQKVNRLTTGPGIENRASLGPLINARAEDKVRSFENRSFDGGAERLTDTKQPGTKEGHFYEPSVIRNVPDSMLQEEIFGPVVSLLSFDNEEEVIHRANDTRAGLAAYVLSKDMQQASRMAAKLDYGMVAVNTCSLSDPRGPFGGMKESGLGREGSIHGLWDFTEIKAIHYA